MSSRSSRNLDTGGAKNAKGFTQDEMAEFKEAFDMFDLDGGGTIESHELKKVMGRLGESLTDAEIEEMVRALDQNGDGEIDFDEFLELMIQRAAERNERDPEEQLRDAFNIFDADGSGFIDRNEVRVLMKKLAQDLTDEEIDSIMDEADMDGDGEISFEEFKAIMFS